MMASRAEKLKRLPRFGMLLIRPRITRFCMEKLQQGYTEQQIIEAAKKAGWKEETIRGILKGLV